MNSRQQPPARRQKSLRPSRKERAPYTDALAQGVAEGRLTHTLYDERLAEVESATSFGELDALVADLPFDSQPRPARATELGMPGPRGRRFVVLSVVALVAAGAMFAIVLEGGGDPAEDAAVAEALVAEEDRAPEGWQPPAVAGELDAVEPMDSTTVAAALDRAYEAGFTDIEQVVLAPDATTVTGMVAATGGEDDETFRQLYLQTGHVGIVSALEGNRGIYLDADDLDLDLNALIEEARGASDAEADQDVRAVLVYRGDGSAERQHEEGNLVQVSFAEGPTVTLRASDQTFLW